MAVATRSTKCPTADELNQALKSGGMVQVATPLRSTLYKQKHAGMFVERDGSLYVQRGKHLDKLSMGDHPLVAIRVVRSERELRPATVVEHPSGTGFAVNVGKQGTNTRWISGGAGPFGGGDIGRWPTKEAATKEAERLGYEVAAVPQPKAPKGELIAKFTERKMSPSTGQDTDYVYEWRLVGKPDDAGREWKGQPWGVERTFTKGGIVQDTDLMRTGDTKQEAVKGLSGYWPYDKAEKYGLAKAEDQRLQKERETKETAKKVEEEQERQDRGRYEQRMKELGTLKGVKKGTISMSHFSEDWKSQERRDVPGYVIGNGVGVVIHGEGRHKTYAVTHLNTGKAMGHNWDKPKEAIALAKAVAELGDWSKYQGEKDIPKTMMNDAAALVRGFTGKWLKPEQMKGKAKVEAPKPTPPEAKEPWKMTRAEYVKSKIGHLDLSKADKAARGSWSRGGTTFTAEYTEMYQRGHKNKVEAALKEGKPVPAEVLKDYPELGKKEELPSQFKILGRGPSGEANVWKAANGEIIERIQKGEKKGWYRTQVGSTEFVGKTPERALEMATEWRNKEPFKGKEGWQIPRADWMKAHLAGHKVPWPSGIAGEPTGGIGQVGDPHWAMVERALKAGKPVPKEVLGHYERNNPEWVKTVRPEPKAEGKDWGEQGPPKVGLKVRDREGDEWVVTDRFTKPFRGFKVFSKNKNLELRALDWDWGDYTVIGRVSKPKIESKPEPKPKKEIVALKAKPSVKQSDRAIAIDRALLAKQVVSVDDPRWLRRPNRFDVRGIDTPGSGRVTSRTGFTDKRQTRMSRKHHRGWKRIKL